jgi:ADP-ribose pyrophosphatase YjhB (NUDIX family)
VDPQWLQWAKELQAIAQIGLTYSSTSHFDVERYNRIREIAAEILASSGDVGSDDVLEVLRREEGYATPKVDVRGVVFRDDEILLVRETSDGRWTLPGGWADVNQTARDAVAREVFEESGYRVAPSKLLAVFDRSRHEHTPSFPFHVYKIFILCRLIDGEPKTSYETSAVGFFAENALPELSTSRVTVAQIRRMFEHLRQDDLPTDFD